MKYFQIYRYKGKWHPSLIANPAYKGKWKPRRIPNPDYYHDGEPFARMTSIGAVGIELWSMSGDIYFDNVLITDDMDVATSWAGQTFELKVSLTREYQSGSLSGTLVAHYHYPLTLRLSIIVEPRIQRYIICCISL